MSSAREAARLIERVLPGAVASAETREQLLELELFPEEQRLVAGAVAKRRREFTTGRTCARRALAKLGVPAAAITTGARGEPIWPTGLVGSITHCRGYTASAVARASDLVALGIDAERNEALPPGVLARVAFGSERELPKSGEGAHRDRLLFSAKEAVCKAWFPWTRRWLFFDQLRISFDRDTGFRAALLVDGPRRAGAMPTELPGRWSLCDGVILTAVAVPARLRGAP